MAALDKIFELLDEEPDLVDAPDAIELAALRGEIRFDDVVFRYGGEDGRGAVPTSTLHVPPGQTVALVGATGAGKSTFAKLVARFYDPTDGPRCSSTATTCATSAPPRCARRWGSCRRRRSCSAARSARTSPSAARTRRARRSRPPARAVGARRVHRGARARLRHRGRRARRRSSRPASASSSRFARALIADPRILVLDEATSNVDIHTESRIEDGLRRLLGRPHRDRHRPPPVDDPPAPGGSSCSTTAGSSSRARTTSCSRPGAPTAALPRLGGAGGGMSTAEIPQELRGGWSRPRIR